MPAKRIPRRELGGQFPDCEGKICRVLFSDNFECIEVRGAVVASQAKLRFRGLSVLRPDMLGRSNCRCFSWVR